MNFSYKAFISYRHSENGRRHAAALETALKRYAKPTLAQPVKIFRDEKHMRPDVSLPKLIRDGLEQSEYLIFLAEKPSADSPWCREELDIWCGELRRTENLIIILIDDDIAIDGTDGIDWAATTALPETLRTYINSIPLYVDLRWAKSAADTSLQTPKYRHEINALSARFRGVAPEELNDEDIRVYRRNIRLRNGALLVLSLMLLTSIGTTLWALDAQKKAEASAAEAIEQQQIAEKALADKIAEERQKELLNSDNLVGSGDVFANSFNFGLALRFYQKADSILARFSDDPVLLEKKKEIARKITDANNRTKPQE